MTDIICVASIKILKLYLILSLLFTATRMFCQVCCTNRILKGKEFSHVTLIFRNTNNILENIRHFIPKPNDFPAGNFLYLSVCQTTAISDSNTLIYFKATSFTYPRVKHAGYIFARIKKIDKYYMTHAQSRSRKVKVDRGNLIYIVVMSSHLPVIC